MENRDGGLKFDDALSFVRPRPWLVDDLGNLKNIEKNIIRIISQSILQYDLQIFRR